MLTRVGKKCPECGGSLVAQTDVGGTVYCPDCDYRLDERTETMAEPMTDERREELRGQFFHSSSMMFRLPNADEYRAMGQDLFREIDRLRAVEAALNDSRHIDEVVDGYGFCQPEEGPGLGSVLDCYRIVVQQAAAREAQTSAP